MDVENPKNYYLSCFFLSKLKGVSTKKTIVADILIFKKSSRVSGENYNFNLKFYNLSFDFLAHFVYKCMYISLNRMSRKRLIL